MVASSDEDAFDALKYALMGTKEDLVSWGHEYLRCLSGQIGTKYEQLIEANEATADLVHLVD